MTRTVKDLFKKTYDLYERTQAKGFIFKLYFTEDFYNSDDYISHYTFKKYLKSVEIELEYDEENKVCIEKTNFINWYTVFEMMTYLAEEKGLGDVLTTKLLVED